MGVRVSEQMSLLSRKGDPWTSKRSKPNKEQTRALVLRVLPTVQPCTDERLVEACAQVDPFCTPSGVRSRRHELATEGLVRSAGEGKTSTGRKALTWEVA